MEIIRGGINLVASMNNLASLLTWEMFFPCVSEAEVDEFPTPERLFCMVFCGGGEEWLADF